MLVEAGDVGEVCLHVFENRCLFCGRCLLWCRLRCIAANGHSSCDMRISVIWYSSQVEHGDSGAVFVNLHGQVPRFSQKWSEERAASLLERHRPG
jgi:Fe-S-cluster-containing hydrogenase component 2